LRSRPVGDPSRTGAVQGDDANLPKTLRKARGGMCRVCVCALCTLLAAPIAPHTEETTVLSCVRSGNERCGAASRPYVPFFPFFSWVPRSQASTRCQLCSSLHALPLPSPGKRGLPTSSPEKKKVRNRTAAACRERRGVRVAVGFFLPVRALDWSVRAGGFAADDLPIVEGGCPRALAGDVGCYDPPNSVASGGPCLGRGRDASQRRAVTDNATCLSISEVVTRSSRTWTCCTAILVSSYAQVSSFTRSQPTDPADRGGHPSDCILTDAFLCGPSELWSIGCALTRHGRVPDNLAESISQPGSGF